MKLIRFSKFFFPAFILSGILAAGGIVGYIVLGPNLGIDFQAGLMQEVRFAPTAFSLKYAGPGNAAVSFDRTGINIDLSGAGVEGRRYSFPFAGYGTIDTLTRAMRSQVEGLEVETAASGNSPSSWLLDSAQGNPQLGGSPYIVHYLAPGAEGIPVQRVSEALISLGRSVSVQRLGAPEERRYMIRLEDSETGTNAPAERIINTLESNFGEGEVALIRSDYVGSRFSKNLTDQVGILLALTLVLILIYSSIRFKPQYAIGAVLAIVHDALIMVAFVVWTRLEFNTTTIAAILTILGYSINDTIVIFDRIRETRRIRPDDALVDILDISLSETLSRTIITTVTTMLAVVSLFIFTTGSMKDFALTLLVGMVSGVYSTIFIASGFVNFWEVRKNKRAKSRLAAPSRAPAKA